MIWRQAEPGEQPFVISMPMTDETKRILDYAIKVAIDNWDDYLGTSHLLIGVCKLRQTRHLISWEN
jgi:hypothetical protein